MAHNMLKEKKMPHKFGGEVVTTTNLHTLHTQQSPTKKLSMKVHQETWYRKCDARRSKLDDKR